jgi:hypothetical protein
MAGNKDKKRKREPTPPYDLFGDFEWSKEEFCSDEGNGSPPPMPQSGSSHSP